MKQFIKKLTNYVRHDIFGAVGSTFAKRAGASPDCANRAATLGSPLMSEASFDSQ